VRSYRWNFIYGLVWFGFIALMTWYLWGRWTGVKEVAFVAFMTFALGMQLVQLVVTGAKWYRTHVFMSGVMQDFTDRLEDSQRAEGDNRPYKRYRDGTIPLHPLDRAALDKLFQEDDDGSKPQV
jgi:hypothetical protein